MKFDRNLVEIRPEFLKISRTDTASVQHIRISSKRKRLKHVQRLADGFSCGPTTPVCAAELRRIRWIQPLPAEVGSRGRAVGKPWKGQEREA